MSPSCDYALDSGGSSLMLSVSSRHQVLGDAKRGSTQKKTTSAGFEPTPPTEKWFRVTRLRPLGQDVISVIYIFFYVFVCSCQSANRQRVNHTVSEERGGDYRAVASSQGMLSEGEKREKEREGFDWWMVWKWVWWRVSSTVVNVSPFTRPLSLRDSHVCIIPGVFLRLYQVFTAVIVSIFRFINVNMHLVFTVWPHNMKKPPTVSPHPLFSVH